VSPQTIARPIRLVAGLLSENALTAVAFTACALGQSATRAGTLWLIKEFLQRTLTGGDSSAARLYAAGGVIFVAWMTTALFEYGAKITQQSLMRRIELSAMMRIVRHMLTLSVGFFERNSHGDLVTLARGDIASLRDVVSSACTVVISAATFIALLVTAFALNSRLAFWGLVVFPLLAAPIIVLGNRIRHSAERRRHFTYRLLDVFVQLFSGIRLIKVYRREQDEIRSCERLGQAYYQTLLDSLRARALAGALLESVAGFGIVLVIVLGGGQLLDGTMQWPSLLTMLMVLMSMHEPLKQVVHSQATLKEQAPSLVRIGTLLDAQPDVQEHPEAEPVTGAPQRITFRDVSFAYPGRHSTLSNIDFEIHSGETIGVVGPSGAGKTTLLGLIARFFDPTRGQVSFDGTDLRRLRIGDVMQQFALVGQEPFLFNDTIRENIRYGRLSATDDEIEVAARAACIHDEILTLPDGYGTVVGVGGMRLSGGQRQRLNIARAVIKDAPILLLDEATSSLDSVAELQVQQAIDSLMQGRTSIVIAHRLSTLRSADRLVVLNGGRIEAIGRHDDLLLMNPTYRSLWETQSRMNRGKGTTASADPVPALHGVREVHS